MEIEKNGIIYSVKENEKSWTLSWEKNRVSLTFNVSKEDCRTMEEVKAFVSETSVF